MIHFENKPHQSWKYKHHIQATFSGSLKSKLGICCHSDLSVMEYLIFYPVFHYFLYYFTVKSFISQPTGYFILLYMLLFMAE